jgi:hypothetical protein
MKTYTAKQAAELQGRKYDALQKELARDAKKPKKLRKYPDAHKCACGHTWLIPAKNLDITPVNNKKRSSK